MTGRGWLAIVVVLGVLTTAAPAATGAQTPSSSVATDLRVIRSVPLDSGTSRSLRVRLDVTFDASDQSMRPTLASWSLLLPRGLGLNGARVPRCSKAVLDRKGPRGCPARAVVGRGHASAPFATSLAPATLVLVNGGPSKLWLYRATRGSTSLRWTATAEIDRLRSRRFGYELTALTELPMALPLVPAPVAPQSFTIVLGSVSRARRYLTWNRGCPPRHAATYRVVANFAEHDGASTSDHDEGPFPCR